jgi:amidohydrolase
METFLNKDEIKFLTDFRRELHKHPEVSGKELETAERVVGFLRENVPSFEIITGVGGDGVLAILDTQKEGQTIVVRCELDALPIKEKNTFDYTSSKPGTAHLCGHDGHMTIVCALALRFQQEPPASGRIILLFQPAEETGEGSQQVLDDAAFNELKISQIIALHNIPAYAHGQILIKEGVICAASTGMHIHLEGRSSHAAEPEKGVSPWKALSTLADFAKQVPNSLENAALITVVGVQMGDADYGISPGNADLWLTLRSNTTETLKQMKKIVSDEAEKLGADQKLEVTIQYAESFEATLNNKEHVERFIDTCKSIGASITQLEKPFAWSEDVGRFTSVYDGFLFGIGAGEDVSPLHAPDYDFPDTLIAPSAAAFEAYIRNELQ